MQQKLTSYHITRNKLLVKKKLKKKKKLFGEDWGEGVETSIICLHINEIFTLKEKDKPRNCTRHGYPGVSYTKQK